MPESTASVPVPHHSSSESGVLYTEKLRPSPWIWIVVVGFSAAGILMFAPISITAGIIAALVLFAITTVLLVTSTPSIVVDQDTVQVGRASIQREFVGAVTAFRKDEATAERGVRLHGLAFLCLRGWIDPVVRIEITDPADRTPYWLTSTRHPDELVAALSKQGSRS
ncbi:hypothetical protein BMF89_02540 [Arthrobacter sp. SRS-W-1-2016]|jgi:hypothetical protein|uniref:DUF3093 domain-containing protein n=1 Tax=Arthrobacter sp. SRS-W-1-2016 TaxID=1930254 RepID=UPI000991270A|nr:DUF3093 domain-containing protein [Arthrobacter sp. SRS-W-1-2016]OOP64738.1 hypothetical protein BMF89_02540 [Arthrobacter sp. SRS-W-1-2016]